MLGLHLQYALHTASFAEQPLSDKTLSRFRKRCYDYETLCGVDLYHDCVKDLSSKIAKIMKLNLSKQSGQTSQYPWFTIPRYPVAFHIASCTPNNQW